MEAKSSPAAPAAGAAPAATAPAPATGKKNQRKKKAAAAPAGQAPANQPKQESKRDIDLGNLTAGGSDAPVPPKDLIENAVNAIANQTPFKLDGMHKLQFEVQFRGLELSSGAIAALIAQAKTKGVTLVRVPDEELRNMPDAVPRVRGPADYFVATKDNKSYYVVLAPVTQAAVYVPKAAEGARDLLGPLTVDGNAGAAAAPVKFSAEAVTLVGKAITARAPLSLTHKQLDQLVSLFSGFSFHDASAKALSDFVKSKGQTLTRVSDADLLNLPEAVPRIRGPADYFVLTDASKSQFYVVVTLGEPHVVYTPYSPPVASTSRGILGDLTADGAATPTPAPAAAAAKPSAADASAGVIQALGDAIVSKKVPAGVVPNIQSVWKSLQLTPAAVTSLVEYVQKKGQTLKQLSDDEIGALPEAVPRPRGAADFFLLTDSAKKDHYITLADGTPYVFFTAK